MLKFTRKNNKRIYMRFHFEPRDIWIGIFWRHTEIALHFYICVLPLIPFHITIEL